MGFTPLSCSSLQDTCLHMGSPLWLSMESMEKNKPFWCQLGYVQGNRQCCKLRVFLLGKRNNEKTVLPVWKEDPDISVYIAMPFQRSCVVGCSHLYSLCTASGANSNSGIAEDGSFFKIIPFFKYF